MKGSNGGARRIYILNNEDNRKLWRPFMPERLILNLIPYYSKRSSWIQGMDRVKGGVWQLSQSPPNWRLLRKSVKSGSFVKRWLLQISSDDRIVRFMSSFGICPFRSLSSIQRFLRAERLPSSVGILPLSWLLESHRVCRLIRLPNSDGILPIALLL